MSLDSRLAGAAAVSTAAASPATRRGCLLANREATRENYAFSAQRHPDAPAAHTAVGTTGTPNNTTTKKKMTGPMLASPPAALQQQQQHQQASLLSPSGATGGRRRVAPPAGQPRACGKQMVASPRPSDAVPPRPTGRRVASPPPLAASPTVGKRQPVVRAAAATPPPPPSGRRRCASPQGTSGGRRFREAMAQERNAQRLRATAPAQPPSPAVGAAAAAATCGGPLERLLTGFEVTCASVGLDGEALHVRVPLSRHPLDLLEFSDHVRGFVLNEVLLGLRKRHGANLLAMPKVKAVSRRLDLGPLLRADERSAGAGWTPLDSLEQVAPGAAFYCASKGRGGAGDALPRAVESAQARGYRRRGGPAAVEAAAGALYRELAGVSSAQLTEEAVAAAVEARLPLVAPALLGELGEPDEEDVRRHLVEKRRVVKQREALAAAAASGVAFSPSVASPPPPPVVAEGGGGFPDEHPSATTMGGGERWEEEEEEAAAAPATPPRPPSIVRRWAAYLEEVDRACLQPAAEGLSAEVCGTLEVYLRAFEEEAARIDRKLARLEESVAAGVSEDGAAERRRSILRYREHLQAGERQVRGYRMLARAAAAAAAAATSLPEPVGVAPARQTVPHPALVELAASPAAQVRIGNAFRTLSPPLTTGRHTAAAPAAVAATSVPQQLATPRLPPSPRFV